MKKLYMNYFGLILSFFCAFPPAVQSQVLAWDFTASGANTKGNEVSVASTTTDAHLNSSLLTRGSGVTATGTLANAFTGSGWNSATQDEAGAIGGNKYYQFTVSAASGFQVSLSTLDVTLRRSATGPTNLQWQYSLDGFASAGQDAGAGFVYNPSPPPTNGDAQAQINLGAIPALQNVPSGMTITFRLFVWGASTASGGTFAIGRPTTGSSLSIGVTTAPSTVTTPTVTGTPGNLSGFSTLTNVASTPAQTETVGGTNLTGDITVTTAGGYEVSTDNSSFLPSVTLPQSGGTVAATPVFVRIAATAAAGPVNGTLNIASPGAAPLSFTLTGTVNSPVSVNPPQSFTATAASPSEIDLNATPNIAGDNILVAFSSTSAAFGTPSGALTAGATISGGGTVIYNGPSAGFSFQHTGRNPSAKYFYSAWSVDGTNTYSTPLAASATTNNPAAAKVVINQVFGGGGNSGSVYTNDFIELFNDADTTVPLSGWSVQYASSTGSSWQVTPLVGTIPAHGFYLIKESKGSAGTTPLPAPDDTLGTIAMAAGSGKVILCNTTAAQTGKIPVGPNLIDEVAYGTSDILEGPGTAPVITDNTTSDVRKTDGLDNNDNAADFRQISPLPRNSTYITTPPVVTSFNPVNGFVGLSASFAPSLVFSKPLVKGSGNVTVFTNGVAGAPIDINDASIVLGNNKVTFNISLAAGNAYAIEVDAGAIKDVYGNSFAGLTTATSWAFTVYNPAVATVLDSALRFDFNTCTGNGLLPNGFTQFSVLGAQIWDCTAFGRDPSAPAGTAAFPSGVQINGFANSINNSNLDWLISPRLDLTATAFPLLSFWSRNAFAGDPLQLKISTDYTGSGDPTLATWTDLNGRFPSQSSDIWTLSSNINLSAFKQGSVYVAFVYKSTTQDGSRWTLDDLTLINSTTPPPPTLTLDAAGLEFGYTAFGSSSIDSVTVTGNDLTTDITLSTGTSNFQVSTDKINFASTATLLQATANNVPQTVYVRLSPSATNLQFSDTLTVSIPDTTVKVTLKGNSVDPASTLNIVNWNLNWFGIADSLGLGPNNKSLQETNVAKILPTLHADLYALQEVVNAHALDSIVATMPGYAYVINNYGSHSNTAEVNHYPLDQIQKLAFVYNTAKFANVHTDSLLSLFGINKAADTATTYYNDWSSGRYPYMLTADVTLSDNAGGTVTKTVRFINIHGKSNLSPVLTSYTRRAHGALILDSLIRTAYINDNVIVLGDYNDDLNQTITTGETLSSFSSFTIDSAAFFIFPTKPLSPAGQHSDVNFSSVIDNVIASKSLSPYYFPGSATVLTDVSSLVSGYGSTTTDHYPVFTQFSFSGVTPLPLTLLDFAAAKQGQQVKLSWTTAQEQNTKSFEVQRSDNGGNFTAIGTVAAKGNSSTPGYYGSFDPAPLPGANYYRLKMIDLDGKFKYSKVLKVDFSSQQTLRISPNPAHATVFISLPDAGDAVSIQILDLSGRTMKQISALPGTQNMPVDLSSFAKGIYTVKVIGSAGVTTQKLLVR